MNLSRFLELRISTGFNMPSPVVKRSIVINGHKTSISLEEPFWLGLKEVARKKEDTLSNIIFGIDSSRTHGNLSSAVRLFVLESARSHLDSQSTSDAY
jgi:predicted DNA-binding ribbon-helix-helix protein